MEPKGAMYNCENFVYILFVLRFENKVPLKPLLNIARQQRYNSAHHEYQIIFASHV
jgi:hypothetical protein